MKNKRNKKTSFSRRSILPILGSGLLLPFFGFRNFHNKPSRLVSEDEYQTLLKPDGTVVKVEVNTVKNSKVIQKNISNKSFLNWLGRKY